VNKLAEVILQNVVKEYGNTRVLEETNLVIPDGSFTVLVGPSGCGKTTTLRMIAGLETITDGTIRISNQVINHVPPGKRDIAMVFQNYAIYPTMNVFDNIAFGLRNRGVSKKDCKVMVEEMAEVVGLTPYLYRKPSQLSGGQRQRVALARAMVKKPEVFLMDEPLSNLDAKLRNQMRVELTSLHKQLGTTFIYVTHDQIEAMTMGDQIVVMNEGKIQQVDSPINLYSNPNNLFVAQFIGSPPMNIIPMGNDESQLAGFRPEKGTITDGKLTAVDKEGQTGFEMKGKVVSREILGSEALYYVETAQGKIIVKNHTDELFAEGLDVNVKVDLQHMYYFNKDTGERIRGEQTKGAESRLTGGIG
jgi:sn-glycerol 3-phosphate transport system ATP-binding protein